MLGKRNGRAVWSQESKRNMAGDMEKKKGGHGKEKKIMNLEHERIPEGNKQHFYNTPKRHIAKASPG